MTPNSIALFAMILLIDMVTIASLAHTKVIAPSVTIYYAMKYSISAIVLALTLSLSARVSFNFDDYLVHHKKVEYRDTHRHSDVQLTSTYLDGLEVCLQLWT